MSTLKTLIVAFPLFLIWVAGAEAYSVSQYDQNVETAKFLQKLILSILMSIFLVIFLKIILNVPTESVNLYGTKRQKEYYRKFKKLEKILYLVFGFGVLLLCTSPILPY